MPTYGLWAERDLDLDAVAAEVDRDSLLDAQRETVATHNEEVNRLVGIFADRVTVPQLAVRTGGSNRLQSLDEHGRPLPVKGRGQYIVGLPLWKGGTAEGWNFWTNAQMTVRDFADSLDLMLVGDVTWLRDQLLAVSFYDGSGFSYSNPQNGESFTVYGPANGDAVTYGLNGGSAATDDHMTFQSDAIADATNPFPGIYTDVTEHPENAGSRVVAFVATNQVAAIKLLADFAPAMPPIVRVAEDITSEPDVAPALNLPLSRAMTYHGVAGNVHVVEWTALPSDYIVSVAVDAPEKPLAMREYAQPALRGLINQSEPMSRFPYQQSNYLRAAGFGARNRVGMHILKIAASYAAPTSYGFPIW